MATKGKAKKRIAIIGYGSQGRAMALNFRDSGYDLIIGLRSRSRSRRVARNDGFHAILTIAEAVKRAEVVCFAFPDHRHGAVFDKEIAPYLKPGAALLFLHGLSIQYGLVKPQTNCDILLLAPHAPGVAVREQYLGDRAISAFYAVHRDYSRRAVQTVIELAGGMGIRKNRLVKTTFRDEAIGDLFGEQAVLCGGLAMLIKTGFDLLVERGIRPENAYLEVAYQLDLIVALIKKHGVQGMLNRISVAARYGSIQSGPKIIDAHTKRQMRRVLKEIESGTFASTLAALTPGEVRALTKRTSRLTTVSLERAGRKYRG